MSSLPLTYIAASRPFVAAPTDGPTLGFKPLPALSKLAGVMPASRLEVRPTPPMVSSGVREIDTLTGGLPRGCLSEICGPASSGRTSVLLAALAAATQRQEVCALVDISDAFHPRSAAAPLRRRTPASRNSAGSVSARSTIAAWSWTWRTRARVRRVTRSCSRAARRSSAMVTFVR